MTNEDFRTYEFGDALIFAIAILVPLVAMRLFF